jgi:radial spoke head protein 4A
MMMNYKLLYLIFLNKLIILNKLVLVFREILLFVFFFFRIWLALKQLIDKGQFEKLRFWGKIIGTEKNYYIAEAEQNAEEETDDDEENEEANANEDGKDVDDEEAEGEEDPLPKSTYKPPPIVPKEERGTGVNKYTYYVCNHRMFILFI